MERKEERHFGERKWGIILLFPLALLYYEIAFRIFTGIGVFHWDTLLLLPLCCVYGGIGYLLCTISGSRRVNIWLTVILLFLAALPFCVEVFLYREFGILYDFRAVFHGAGNAVQNFGGEVVRLVFSFKGILCIAVYLLPSALFALFGSAPTRISWHKRGMTAARLLALYILVLALIHVVPDLALAYGDEYSFQTSVERIGLMTGTGLDVREMLMGRGAASFEQIDMGRIADQAQPEQTADPDASPEPSAEPVEYGLNQLDLNLSLDTPDDNEVYRSLDAYVAGLTASSKNQYTGMFAGKNLIMITAEAFTKEVIDPELTPALYRMYTKGVHFTDYYQFAGAGTTGGEYQHIFGMLPSNSIDSMLDMTSHHVLIDMPMELYMLGYYGVGYHNGKSDFYDRDVTHPRLGFSDGFYAFGNGLEDIMGTDWDTSDKEMFEKTVPTYIDRQPFVSYYMTISAHTPYSFKSNYWASKNKDRVADLPYSDMVRGYIASNLELEDAMAYLIQALEDAGIADDTVICLTPDHYPYGLEDGDDDTYLAELYGMEEIETAFDRDHSCWLLWCGALEDEEPIVVDEPTCSLDILPTMLNLFGIDFDSRLLPGRDVFSDAPALAFASPICWKTSYGYFSHGSFHLTDETADLPESYVDDIRTVVRNKVNYCQAVLDNDYFTVLFWERR